MAGNAIDVDELIKQFALQSEVERTTIEGLDKVQRDLGSSVDTEVEAIQKEANLQGAIQRGVDNILINRAQKNKETAAFFGVNPEAHNSIIQKMAEELITQHGEITQSAKQIQEKQSVGFTDDPLAWFTNAFTLQGDVAAHNTRVAIFDRHVEALTKLGQLADAQIARNNAIDANTTAELSTLAAERLRAAAEIRVQDARQKAMQAGIQIGSVRLATSQQQFSNLLQLHNAKVSLQQLDLARANKTHNDEMRELQKKNLQLLIDAKEEDAKAQQDLQNNLDRATAILGMRRITAREYKSAPQQIQRALFDVMSNPNITQGRLGYDVVDALETVNSVNAPLTPGTTETKNLLLKIGAEASMRPEFAALKPAEKHVKVNELIMGRVKAEANNIPEVGGLYSAPSMYAVGQIPAVASTILWKSTFEPQAKANKMLPTRPQAVYDAAVALIADNKMDIERGAAEIATIFKAIAVDNTQQRDYNRFALPMQNNYRTTIQTNAGPLMSALGGNQILDMSNPTEVKRAIMRTLAAQKASEGMRGMGIYN